MIFTDSSVWEGSVGAGSCAALLFSKSDDDYVWTQTSAVGTNVSAFECEVERVGLSITMAIQYLQNVHSLKAVDDVYIFCDCLNAICCTDSINFKWRPDIFLKFQAYRQQLHDHSIRIILVKVTGHTKIQGNEIANQHSRNAAKMTAQGNISAPSNVATDDAYKIANDIVRKSRQCYWNHESKGRYTYHLIPLVATKVTFPDSRDIGISYMAEYFFMILC